MAAEVRAARAGEEDAILPLYEWLFASPGYRPPQWEPQRARSALARAIAGPGSVVLVAEEDGRLVGICSAYIDIESVRYGQRCWIEDLAVDPERRSGGIGAALLAAARGWARAHGASHIELDTGIARVDAQRFYDRQGEAGKGISYSWRLS
jgi:GNAT superfamily N-acetyltransferase